MTDGTPHDTDTDRYLFIVDYDDDAERKRIEYLFNNWEDGDVEKPSGIIRITTDTDHDDLYQDLVTKVPDNQVQSYRLEPIETSHEPETKTVTETISARSDAVETFLEYVFSKKKAVLQSASANEYEIYTKKGRADVTYTLTTTDGTTDVTIIISGYPPAPEFLADFFQTELQDFATSQEQ